MSGKSLELYAQVMYKVKTIISSTKLTQCYGAVSY